MFYGCLTHRDPKLLALSAMLHRDEERTREIYADWHGRDPYRPVRFSHHGPDMFIGGGMPSEHEDAFQKLDDVWLMRNATQPARNQERRARWIADFIVACMVGIVECELGRWLNELVETRSPPEDVQ